MKLSAREWMLSQTKVTMDYDAWLPALLEAFAAHFEAANLARIEVLEAENNRLGYALQRYGLHDRDCEYCAPSLDVGKCSCGFRPALAGESPEGGTKK